MFGFGNVLDPALIDDDEEESDEAHKSVWFFICNMTCLWFFLIQLVCQVRSELEKIVIKLISIIVKFYNIPYSDIKNGELLI